MKKQFLLSFLALFTIVFLLTGCEKNQSAPEKKNQPGNPLSKENTPSSETMTEEKEVMLTEDEIKNVSPSEPLKSENQKFEGSQSLKRYLDDSP